MPCLAQMPNTTRCADPCAPDPCHARPSASAPAPSIHGATLAHAQVCVAASPLAPNPPRILRVSRPAVIGSTQGTRSRMVLGNGALRSPYDPGVCSSQPSCVLCHCTEAIPAQSATGRDGQRMLLLGASGTLIRDKSSGRVLIGVGRGNVHQQRSPGVGTRPRQGVIVDRSLSIYTDYQAQCPSVESVTPP